MKILITENQLKNVVVPFFDYKNRRLEQVRENWSKLNDQEKELVIELYKISKPKYSKQINEGFMDWIQTGLDVGGIFDPTGIADSVNAVIYFSRGEILFGMLSLISVIPFIGDAIGKPIVFAAKAAKTDFKLVSTAVKTKNATKIAETTKSIKNTPFGKKMIGLLDNFSKGDLGKKIMSFIGKIKKIPIVGRFASLIENWVKVFEKAGKEMKIATKAEKIELKTPQGLWKGTLKGTERVDWSNAFKKMFTKPEDFKMFRNLATDKNAVKLFGRKIYNVPATRQLLGRTKLFTRFLDHLGIGNFIGPDEVLEKVPDAENKFADFVQTPEGGSLFKQEIISLL